MGRGPAAEVAARAACTLRSYVHSISPGNFMLEIATEKSGMCSCEACARDKLLQELLAPSTPTVDTAAGKAIARHIKIKHTLAYEAMGTHILGYTHVLVLFVQKH
jgi:hypothetical protein